MEHSPGGDSNQKCNGTHSMDNSSHVEQELMFEGPGNESRGIELTGFKHANDENINTVAAADDNGTKSGAAEKQNSKNSARKGRKVNLKLRPRRYLLRSSHVGVRVLRSMTKEKDKASSEPVTSPVNPVIKTRKKKSKGKKALNDEFSLTRKRVRYLLTRMNYEQSLIDAYSTEGWKGQSLEKIRPEKELERAKSEILRCKLRIRESFRHLDSLLSEGSFEESMFDSDGQIDSEDIFCARCCSKDVSADNDIILCDGNCNRGFHQKCLSPPLLTEQIPPEDEGWLCPACDCKVDCLELLNEFQGSNLSVEDTWEKVFPEAAAAANGNTLYEEANYPSDDSEDNDYNPDVPEVVSENDNEESSSEESTSLSEESGPSNYNRNYDDLALPSDDSEDDDYDPEGPDHSVDVKKEESTSSESDFTSDSDDFCAELSKLANSNDVSTPPQSNIKPLDICGEGRHLEDAISVNSEILHELKADTGEGNVFPASRKRQCERFDYKKLYDETYGKGTSDSSDDEDWSEKSTPKKVKKDDNGKEPTVTLEAGSQPIENQKILRSLTRELKDVPVVDKSNLDNIQVSQAIYGSTPSRTCQNLAEQHAEVQLLSSNGNKATTFAHRLGQEVSQKLQELLKEDQYPSRETKERLSEELGLTIKQINKWFGNARHSMKVSAKGAEHPQISKKAPAKEANDPGTSTDKGTFLIKTNNINTNSVKEVARSSASNRGNAKLSKIASDSHDVTEHDISEGLQSKQIVDSARQKAIARELRRRRYGR